MEYIATHMLCLAPFVFSFPEAGGAIAFCHLTMDGEAEIMLPVAKRTLNVTVSVPHWLLWNLNNRGSPESA